MFRVNKYETTKLFIKKDPKNFDVNNKSISKRACNLSKVAAIHAENADIESARKYYLEAITIVSDKLRYRNIF